MEKKNQNWLTKNCLMEPLVIILDQHGFSHKRKNTNNYQNLITNSFKTCSGWLKKYTSKKEERTIKHYVKVTSTLSLFISKTIFSWKKYRFIFLIRRLNICHHLCMLFWRWLCPFIYYSYLNIRLTCHLEDNSYIKWD